MGSDRNDKWHDALPGQESVARMRMKERPVYSFKAFKDLECVDD